jgi:hypothetical protein
MADRSLVIAAVALVAASAFAFNDRRLPQHARIDVLATPDRYLYGHEQRLNRTMQQYLSEELTSAGFDAAVSRETFDDLQRSEETNADYYVEVVYTDVTGRPIAEISTGGPVGVDVGIESSRVRAELRLYDGWTLEMVDRYQLQQSRIVPVIEAVGVLSANIYLQVAVPIVRHAQLRSAIRAVAHEGAERIASSRGDSVSADDRAPR